MPAHHVTFSADDVARKEIGHVGPHLNHLTDEFMTDNHGYGDGLLGPRVPVVDMEIGSANAGLIDSNQDIIDAVFRPWDVFQPQPRNGLFLN